MQLWCATDDSLAGRAAVRVAAELAMRLHAESSMPDPEIADPIPRLAAAARATGCGSLVVGVMPCSRAAAGAPAGWHHLVVAEARCPVMLVPVGATMPTRGVVLAQDVDELPHLAARVAGRLADRLRVPLLITDVISASTRAPRRSEAQVRRGQRALLTDTRRAAGSSSGVHAGTSYDRDLVVPQLAAPEAALVVIAGRGAGRTLLPRRRLAGRLTGARLPIVIVPPHAG